MEWRNPYQVARLEAYATGYLDTIHQRGWPHRTCKDYEAGAEHALNALAGNLKLSQTPHPT